MKDFADRMKEIKHALSDEPQQQQQGAEAAAGSAAAAAAVLSLSEKEALCDELMDIVESVDCARGRHEAKSSGCGVSSRACARSADAEQPRITHASLHACTSLLSSSSSMMQDALLV
jgi:hypothetical protein